jgi:DNA-binding transcriptional MerR regulator/quercetin dioxygenase-like cupin family protein
LHRAVERALPARAHGGRIRVPRLTRSGPSGLFFVDCVEFDDKNAGHTEAVSMSRKEIYLSISKVARILGVSASSLRNWEAIGLITPMRSDGRYRLYSPALLNKAKRIKYLRQVEQLNPRAILHIMGKGQRGAQVQPAPSGRSEGIAARLRRLRRKQQLTLTAAAHKVGISASLLSAVERGQANPSIATLQKLTHLYGTNVLSFFGDGDSRRRLVHPQDRKVLRPYPGVQIELLAFGRPVMEPHLYRIAPGASSGGSYHHEGEEFIYVIQGSLEMWLDEVKRYVLETGDSLYFESTHTHRWQNLGDQEAVLIWVNTPPTF